MLEMFFLILSMDSSVFFIIKHKSHPTQNLVHLHLELNLHFSYLYRYIVGVVFLVQSIFLTLLD